MTGYITSGIASYYDIGEQHGAAWSYRDAWPEVGRVSDLVSFEADKVEVYLDGQRMHLEPGQGVVAHGSTVVSTPTRSSPAPVTGPDHVVA